MKPSIKIENLSKQYRLGVVGTGTLSHDLKRWWTTSIRGKEDPYLKIGETNVIATRNSKLETRNSKLESQYVWALKDINLEIEQGDVVGIIGKNGAGKSTLLKLLSRVTKPTTGSIQYNGRIASLLEVGTGFHQEMTGRENIYMNGAIMGMTRHEITSKLDEIIAFAGVERYIDTPVKRYSSGMTVRLGFSIAAHLEPDILVVDEVLAVGDAEFQKKAIGKMQDVSKGGGRTVLFVSHNMAAVKSLCKSGVLLFNGQIACIDEIDAVINKYLNTTKIPFSKLSTDNRQGTGVIKVVGISVFGDMKEKLPQVGSPFNIVINLENQDKIQSRFIRVDLRIDDIQENRLLWLSTVLTEPCSITTYNTINFHIEKLNLNEGEYTISIQVVVKDIISDWIQKAFYFKVNDGVFYSNSYKVPLKQSYILSDFNINYYDK